MEMLSDELRKAIGDKARKDAETNSFNPPEIDERSYWSLVVSVHKVIFYQDIFDKRVKRLERMKNNAR